MADLQIYDIGDRIKLEVNVLDDAGAAATPTEIKLVILRPNGSFLIHALTDLGSEIVADDVGLYSHTFVAAYSGQHDFRWEVTGPGEGTEEGRLWVNLNRLQDQAP